MILGIDPVLEQNQQLMVYDVYEHDVILKTSNLTRHDQIS